MRPMNLQLFRNWKRLRKNGGRNIPMRSATGKITRCEFFLPFSGDIRRIMYTTNIIEGLNRQYRKVTKTKSVFPSDTALEKMLFLASRNVTKKWTQRYRNWDQVLNQLIILYLTKILSANQDGCKPSINVFTLSLGIYSIPRKSPLFLSRVWAEPTIRDC